MLKGFQHNIPWIYLEVKESHLFCANVLSNKICVFSLWNEPIGFSVEEYELNLFFFLEISEQHRPMRHVTQVFFSEYNGFISSQFWRPTTLYYVNRKSKGKYRNFHSSTVWKKHSIKLKSRWRVLMKSLSLVHGCHAYITWRGGEGYATF